MPDALKVKACIYCREAAITKKGVRVTRNGKIQMYGCRSCGRRFSLAPMPSFVYPAEIILNAPVLYYLGHTLREIRKRIERKFSLSPSIAVISNWVERFGKFSAMKKQRQDIRNFSGPSQVIRRRLLNHRQQYLFQVHAYKIEKLEAGFASLKHYLMGVLDNKYPIDAESFVLRGSKIALSLEGHTHVESRKECYASKVAELALKAAKTNLHRHAAIQRFFLAMDKTTVAVEVPVFLSPGETSRILRANGGLLGHIDFLQVIGDRVLILDYKPDAAKEKEVIQQLFSYAVALSVRTEIQLAKIDCAWFDERDYFKFRALDAYINFKNSITSVIG